MPEPLPPPSLTRAREQKIAELSTHFANDDLSLEDLERRIERVYKAVSVAELESITADLRSPEALVDPRAEPARGRVSLGANAPVTGTIEAARSRLVAFMSSTRRVGRWAVPRDMSVFALMSDTRLDLTSAALPVGGIVHLELNAIMAAVKIIVPPGMRVVNEIHSFMSDVRSGADELATEGLTSPTAPIIRLTGMALMAEVNVKVRRREDPYQDDD